MKQTVQEIKITLFEGMHLNAYSSGAIIASMAWDVELTEECEAWWHTLTEAEQESVGHGFDLLVELGPALSRPYADTLKRSRFPNLKELRIQHEGRPYRVLFAFDPRRVALLLLGGDKTGDPRWYEKAIPQAETIYARHLEELK